MTHLPVPRAAALLLIAVLAFALHTTASAHEIPARVVVQTWVEPQADELTVLVRVPLEAMRDVVWPLRGPGYLDIAAADEVLADAAETWIVNQLVFTADGQELGRPAIVAARLSLPSNRAFREFDDAVAHIASPPLPPQTELYVTQALFDVHLRYPPVSPQAGLAIDARFRRLGLDTTTVVRFVTPDDELRVFELGGDAGPVQLDPRWHHAFARFVAFGFEHILDGIDHLLFVLCLVIPFRRVRPLVAIVTSFTVGHSLTLIGSAFGLTPSVPWFPAMIETLIAASIVYMALENLFGARWERRWLVAFGFGLVHGFGFSFALTETLQFAGTHVLTSLLAFNLGVEIGQLLIVAIAVPLLALALRAGLPEKATTIVLSAILAHSAWHWMSERAAELVAWSPTWPGIDGGTLLRWLILFAIAALTLRLMHAGYQWLMSREKP